MEFLIRVTNYVPENGTGPASAYGEIIIGLYRHCFYIPTNVWSIDDYRNQWREGIARIQDHDTSCLVIFVKPGCVRLYALYKEANIVFIQEHVYCEEHYQKIIGANPYTTESCYDYIAPYDCTNKDFTKSYAHQIPLQDLRYKNEDYKHVLPTNHFAIYQADMVCRPHKGIPYFKGFIEINNFKESFYMNVSFWSLEDYQRQWREGIERLKTHGTSCLVTGVNGRKKVGTFEWWSLYREEDVVLIYNQRYFPHAYRKTVGKNPFTPDTCYQYIRPSMLTEICPGVSEWQIPLSAMLKSVEE